MAYIMPPERFSECLQTIGWTQRGVAARLGIPEQSPRRWAGGLYPVPDEVARWLEKLVAAHERNPPPDLA
jgi:hypothetical protein